MTGFAPFDVREVPLVGTNLIEASAGTGKTYAITTLLVRLLVERELDLEKILIVTFTEAATAELRDRVRHRLGVAIHAFDALDGGVAPDDPDLNALAARSEQPGRDRARLEAALHNADLASIFTIHGFCHRVLQDCAFESGAQFDAEILTDDHLLRDEVVGDFWARELCSLPVSVVGRLLHTGFDLRVCASLVDKALRHPDAPVLPKDVPAAEMPPVEEFTAAWKRARSEWDEQEVLGLLTSGALSGRWYRDAWVQRWCADMAEYLRHPPDYPHVIDRHSKFCAASVRQAVKKAMKVPEHPFFEACEVLESVSARFEAGASARIVELHRQLMEWSRAELARRKESAGVVSFDDLLQGLRAALRGAQGKSLATAIRRRYAAALIDEFQDTDPVQYDIFDAVFGAEGSSMFLVGDPKQAIYSFRGADVFAYLEAVRNAPDDRRFTMATNWRSDPLLLDGIARLYEKTEHPFLIPDIQFAAVQPRPGAEARLSTPGGAAAPVDLVFVPRVDGGRNLDNTWVQRRYPDLVAAEISATLASEAEIDGKAVTPSDVAVLTRTNQQAFAIQTALRKLRIPSVVLGDESVFESREAEELQRVLACVVEPMHGLSLRAALATELLGVTANEIERMDRDERAWEEWVHDFRGWNELWATKGFVQMIRALMVRRGVQQRLLSLVDGERRMTNLLHLVELLHTAARARHLGPAGLLHWLAEQRTHARVRPESAQIRLESDDRAVRITTVHRSKGLEYGIVFCPYLWDGMLLHPDDERVLSYHDDSEGYRMVLQVTAEPGEDTLAMARAKWEKLAENLRLLYVAMTRAKHRCTIFWGARYRFEQSALAYLLYPPGPIPAVAADELRQYLGDLDDAGLLARLEELAEGSGAAISVRVADPEIAGTPYERRQEEALDLTSRRATRRVDRLWRTASFTQLTSMAAAEVPEGREQDEGAEQVEAAPEAEGEVITLSAFPRGARPGNFFHEVLENVDFAAARHGPVEGLDARLSAYGMQPETWRSVVQRSLEEIVTAPLRDDWTLADVPMAKRLNELEFHLPVAAGADHLTDEALAAVFRQHPSAELGDYADHAERLRFPPLHGYLKGYVDLVFEHGGQWYVVDYKTSWLGERVGDYEPSALRKAMSEGHYYLQYHLYAVAVHRYLARGVTGYSYDEHFGGVLYLFLRGMTPRHPGAGVFFERPSAERIGALSDLMRAPVARTAEARS